VKTIATLRVSALYRSVSGGYRPDGTQGPSSSRYAQKVFVLMTARGFMIHVTSVGNDCLIARPTRASTHSGPELIWVRGPNYK